MHGKVWNERERGGNWETCIGTVNGILFSKASVPPPSLARSLFRLSRFICAAVAVGSHGREGERGEGEIEAEKKWVSVHSVD